MAALSVTFFRKFTYKELDKRFAVIGSRKVTKQARIEATVLNSQTLVSKADIGKILPDVSATTIEAVPSGRWSGRGLFVRLGRGVGPGILGVLTGEFFMIDFPPKGSYYWPAAI